MPSFFVSLFLFFFFKLLIHLGKEITFQKYPESFSIGIFFFTFEKHILQEGRWEFQNLKLQEGVASLTVTTMYELVEHL